MEWCWSWERIRRAVKQRAKEIYLAVKDVSFDVIHSGDKQFTDTWVKQGDRFVPQGGSSWAIDDVYVDPFCR